MIKNMAHVLNRWQQPVTLKTLVAERERYKPVEFVTIETIQAVVQPPRPQVIAALGLDMAARYYTIHSKTALQVGQFFEYDGADYRIIELLGWGDYGFYEAIGQDTKKPLLVVEEA